MNYRFESMGSLADYFENKARDLREHAKSPRKKQDILKLTTEAFTLEGVAHMLRDTIITKETI